MERGDWPRAESLLAKAVESCPADSDARRLYAETLWRRGATNAAIVQLEEARKNSPDEVTLTVRIGEMYLAMGRWDAALAAADQTLDLDPKSAAAWGLRGAALITKGEPQQALAAYQRALSYAPGNADLHLKVAEAYRRLGQPDRALAALETLAEGYPPGEEPQTVLYLEGLALTALGRHADAVASLTQSSRRGQPTPEILYRLAEAQYAAGDAAPALENADRALALDPNHPGSRALRERIQIARNGAAQLR